MARNHNCHPAAVPFWGTAVVVLLSLTLASCSAARPEPRYIPVPRKSSAASAVRSPVPVPSGWADITIRAKLPQIKLWLVYRGYTATMVLREWTSDSATTRSLQKENGNVLGTLSMVGKVTENDPERRVTRVPSIVDGKRNISAYSYTENGLLRRVAVFRNHNRIWELELIEEQATAEFDALTVQMMELAAALCDR